MPGIVIHTEGSCHGNPGPGGYSAIIQIPPNIQVRGHHPNTTNNQMEMTAVIEGLARLGQFVGIDDVDVEVRTDSEYVCNGFNKGWLTKWHRTAGSPAERRPSPTRSCGKICSGSPKARTSPSLTSGATPETP